MTLGEFRRECPGAFCLQRFVANFVQPHADALRSIGSRLAERSARNL
jgi:hypothetical protein